MYTRSVRRRADSVLRTHSETRGQIQEEAKSKYGETANRRWKRNRRNKREEKRSKEREKGNGNK